MNFERNVFVYWDAPIDSAPIYVKASYEKLQYATQRDGWKLHLITDWNIHDYIPDYDRFQKIFQSGKKKTVHEKSDMLRIYLIEQYGGVWMEFTTILFQNLDWLSDDGLFDQLIINKVGKNIDDPDMLIFGEAASQSPYSYYNKQNRLVSQQYFGTAIHFIAAKKKSRIMTAWKNKYDSLADLDYFSLMPEIIQKRIYLRNSYQERNYLLGSIAFQAAIQQKQQQLDDNISLFNIFSPRQNVYEHFKVWQVHGEVGPNMISRYDSFYFAHLFSKTKEEIENKTGKLWFFMKLNVYWKGQVWKYQEKTQNYFKNHPQKTVLQILRKGPTIEECKLFFIVNGSILHMLYQNSKYRNELKAPFLSIPQRQMLRRYCLRLNPEMYKQEKETRWYSEGQRSKSIREVMYANMTSFWDKISIIPIVYDQQLQSAKYKWQEAIGAILIYLILRNIIIFSKEIKQLIKKKLSNGNNQSFFCQSSVNDAISVNYLKENCYEHLNKKNILRFFSWIGFNLMAIALLFAKGLAYIINYQFFQEFDQKGYMGHWVKLFLVISFNVILDWVIGKFINHKYANTFVSMETILKETRMMLYLPLGYVAVLHMYILFGFAHHHTMNFVAGGLLLYTWLEEANERKVGFVLFKKIASMLSNIKWPFLGLFLAYGLNKNLRYLRLNNHYVKQYIADILNIGFWILLYSVTVYAVVNFGRRLFFIECTQQKKQKQTQIEKKRRHQQRTNIYHCLLMLLVIWMVTYTTSKIYDRKVNFPFDSSYYNQFSRVFKFLLALYMLCATMIRLSIKSKMHTIYGILLTFFTTIPIVYWCYGQELQGLFDWNPTIRQLRNVIVIVFVVVEQLRCEDDTQTQNMHYRQMVKLQQIDSFAEIQS